MGFDRSGWEPVLTTLRRHFRLVLVDNRGTGRSDRPDGSFEVTDMAGDVVAVLDAAGIGRAAALAAGRSGGPVRGPAGRSPLDVRDRAAVFAAVETAADAFGRLDIVINNAGYGLTGAVEEITEDAAREIIDTNFFGTLWVCQAVAPHLRARRSGRIVQMSSIAGLTGLPTQGLYAASKFAVEGMSESLAHELASFGITVTLVEPGAHATGFTGPSLRFAEFTDAYQPVRAALIERYAHASFGDPARVAEAILAIVNDPKPPRRVLLGGEYDMIMDLYRQRQEEWQAWRHLSRAAG